MKKFFRKLLCLIGDHDWTCKAEQGIPPTQQQLDGGVAGFYDYAAVYCKHCGTIMERFR